jgi:hypothetical protein
VYEYALDVPLPDPPAEEPASLQGAPTWARDPFSPNLSFLIRGPTEDPLSGAVYAGPDVFRLALRDTGWATYELPNPDYRALFNAALRAYDTSEFAALVGGDAFPDLTQEERWDLRVLLFEASMRHYVGPSWLLIPSFDLLPL